MSEPTYTQAELEAAVNERIHAAYQAAAAHRPLRIGLTVGCGCGWVATEKVTMAITDQWAEHIPSLTPQSALDAQEKRDARVRLEEAKWWHRRELSMCKHSEFEPCRCTACARISELEAAAR